MVPTAVRFEIAGIMLGFFPVGALFFQIFGEAGSGGFGQLAPASDALPEQERNLRFPPWSRKARCGGKIVVLEFSAGHWLYREVPQVESES